MLSFNHTIVIAEDKRTSAEFFAYIFGTITRPYGSGSA